MDQQQQQISPHRRSSLRGFAEYLASEAAEPDANTSTVRRLLHCFGLLGWGVAISGIMAALLVASSRIEWMTLNEEGVPMHSRLATLWGISIPIAVFYMLGNTANVAYNSSSAAGPIKALWTAGVGLTLGALSIGIIAALSAAHNIHYYAGEVFVLFFNCIAFIIFDFTGRMAWRSYDEKHAARQTVDEMFGIPAVIPFFSGGPATRLAICLVVHPLLLEAAEAMSRASSAQASAQKLQRGDITFAQAESRVIQSTLPSYALKQFMSFVRRLMLLNMGGSTETLAALVAASLEEALTRGFLVEVDTWLRRWTGQPELRGDELTLQRIVWMCDANMSAIAEFNAIFTSTFAQVIMQRHALVLALGYEPETKLDVAAAFVQLMLEISLEVMVDTTAMWAESEHGIPVTEYFWYQKSLLPLATMIFYALCMLCVSLFCFIRAPLFTTCSSNDVCDCIEQPQYQGWYTEYCADAHTNSNDTLTNHSTVRPPEDDDLFAKVDGTTVIVALATGIAMLALTSLSVLFMRYRKKITTVVDLTTSIEKNVAKLEEQSFQIRAAEEAAAKAQAVVDSVLSASYQFDTKMLPFLINHDELTFECKLGEGSFGEVWAGKLRGTEAVAIKQIRMTRITDECIEDFRAECEIMAQLRHEHLVLFHGAVYKNGPDRLALVLELAANGTLEGLLESKEESWGKHLAQIARGIASCVAYLHGRSPTTIHRDLKPANVLVSATWEAKVADFGVSTTFDAYEGRGGASKVATMTFAGTPAFMAPEVLCSQRYNESVDVYAPVVVGESGYVQRFFEKQGPAVLISSTGDFIPPIPAHVRSKHPGVVAIVEVCCQKDIARRARAPAIVNLLAAELLKVNREGHHLLQGQFSATEWSSSIGNSFVGFLSSHKASTAMEARFMKTVMEKMLGIKKSFFLDSDNLCTHSELKAAVKNSKVLLLLQSAEVLLQPRCILEVYTAIEHGVPIVPILCVDRGYAFSDAHTFLTHLDTMLAQAKTSISSVLLREHGVEMTRAAHVLSAVIPSLISQKFDASGSTEVIDGQLRTILRCMQSATPSAAPAELELETWVTSRGRAPLSVVSPHRDTIIGTPLALAKRPRSTGVTRRVSNYAGCVDRRREELLDTVHGWIATCGKKFVGFLSHHKVSTAMEARFMKTLFEGMLGLDGAFFLDSDNLRSLSELLADVKNSSSLVLLLSSEIMYRPWCLLELYTAITHGVPIVPVLCSGKGYDFTEVQTFLTHLDTMLERANPYAPKVLRSNGIELRRMAHVLSTAAHALTSTYLKFDASTNTREIDDQLLSILESMQTATIPVAPAESELEAWVAARGPPPERVDGVDVQSGAQDVLPAQTDNAEELKAKLGVLKLENKQLCDKLDLANERIAKFKPTNNLGHSR